MNSILHEEKFETFATRHGIATEPHAKRAIIEVLKSNGHKKVQHESMGTLISDQYPFLSASPDLKVSCGCCGVGLVEIKCPYNIREKSPCPEELPQLSKNTDGSFHLKTAHSHFYQIQCQLGISKLKYCYYFVFTHHGHFIEKIEFNQSIYQHILENTSLFW